MATFRFDPNSSLIRLSALVYGAVFSVDIALDTGASVTLLTPQILRHIGLDPNVIGRPGFITTASRIEQVTLLTVPRLDALGQSLTNLDVNCKNLPASLQIDGLLGLNFLRHFKLYINFFKGVLVIHERSPRSFFHRLSQLFELAKAYW